MKKLLSVLFSIVLIFMLVSCSEKSKNERDKVGEAETQSEEAKTAKEETPKDVIAESEKKEPKNGKDILKEFLLQHGGYVEDIDGYRIVKDVTDEDNETAYFLIMYGLNDDTIRFVLSNFLELESGESVSLVTVAELGTNQNNSIITVSQCFVDENDELYALGVIHPEQVSMENLEIFNIDYILNDYPLQSNPEIEQQIYTQFEIGVKKLLAYLYATLLIDIPNITMQDLGFTNFVPVTD